MRANEKVISGELSQANQELKMLRSSKLKELY